MDKKTLSAIILVAGSGKRIKKLTTNPKCLLKIGNTTILKRNLSFLLSKGIKNIFVVVGFEYKKIEKEIFEFNKKNNINISIVHNKKYLTHGNCYSLYLALKKVKNDIIFFDGDLVYEKKLLKQYLNHKSKNSILVGEGDQKDVECAKIYVEKKRVKKIIEKKLYKSKKYKFLGEALGINKLDIKSTIYFLKKAKKIFISKKYLQLNWDTFYDKFVLKKLNIQYCFTKSKKWIEIDTYEDYKNSLKIFNH